MRCVVFATGHCPNMGRLNESHPAPLAPLVDRPFLQHVVESLVGQGIGRIDFVLSHLPEQIEALLGSGERWGSRFTYHLARDPGRPYSALKSIDLPEGNEPVLVVHADRLVLTPLEDLRPENESALPRLIASPKDNAADGGEAPEWTGWAWVSAAMLRSTDPGLTEAGFEKSLRCENANRGRMVFAADCLKVRSLTDLQRANSRLLTGGAPGLLLGGREIESGVRVARGAQIDPTARLVSPVFVGENSMVGKNVILGPNVILGDNAVVDSCTVIQDSIIFQNTYVGQSLDVKDMVCDRDRIISTRLGTEIRVPDNFVMGELSAGRIRQTFRDMLTRLSAAILLVAGSPLLLVIALCLWTVRRGPVFHTREFVLTPAPAQKAGWRRGRVRSFLPADAPARTAVGRIFLTLLPGLVSVARGELGFVGVVPRSIEEVGSLPPHWKSLHLRNKSGLVHEACANPGEQPRDEELYIAEAFNASDASLSNGFKLVCRYLRKREYPRATWAIAHRGARAHARLR